MAFTIGFTTTLLLNKIHKFMPCDPARFALACDTNPAGAVERTWLVSRYPQRFSHKISFKRCTCTAVTVSTKSTPTLAKVSWQAALLWQLWLDVAHSSISEKVQLLTCDTVKLLQHTLQKDCLFCPSSTANMGISKQLPTCYCKYYQLGILLLSMSWSYLFASFVFMW